MNIKEPIKSFLAKVKTAFTRTNTDTEPTQDPDTQNLWSALSGTARAGYDTYMVTRAKLLMTIVFVYVLIIFEMRMKFLGYTLVDIFITTAVFFATLVITFDPRVAALAEAFEIFHAKREKTASRRDPDHNYLLLYEAYVLQWTSIISMFVIILPFGWYLSFTEAFMYTMVGLLCISVIAWAAFFHWTTKVYYKKVILTAAVCGLVYSAWMIVVPLSFKNWIAPGMNFYGAAGTSETAKEVARTKWAAGKASDNKTAKEVRDEIKDELVKKCQGEESCLSADKRARWRKINAEVDGESLYATAKYAGSQIDLSSLEKSSGGKELNFGSTFDNYSKKMRE